MSSALSTALPGIPPKRRFPLGAVVWGVVLATGFGSLLTYQMRSGAPATSPGTWPARAKLPFDSQRYNLVMFAHPQCPCSAASLEELKVVLTQAGERINSTVCFFEPEAASDWTETRLVRAAKSVSGLNVVIDRDGAITEKFGAMTSGQVVLFDSRGQRVFSGGITGARGHAGWNRGRALVLAAAKGEICSPDQTAVFGCALHDPADAKDPAL